jgi:hypothetical protein
MLARRGADPDAGVVDEHVQTAIAIAVPVNHLANRVLVGHVCREMLDLESLLLKLMSRALDPFGLASSDRQRKAFLAEHLGEGKSDASRGSSDDGGTVGHYEPFFRDTRCRNLTTGVVPPRDGPSSVQAVLAGACSAAGSAATVFRSSSNTGGSASAMR